MSLDETLQRIERLSDPSDRENAMRSLFNGGADIDEICALDFGKIIPRSATERQRVIASFCQRINEQASQVKTPDGTSKLLRKCLDLTAVGWLDTAEAVRAFQLTGDHGSFAQWEMVEGMKWELPKDSYNRVREQVIKNMAAEDPERAIRTLAEKVSLKQRYPMLSKAYEKMREDSPGTCVEKVRALLPEFDPETCEQLGECVIRGALLSGDLELAKEWMSRISNPKLKKNLSEEYATALELRKSDLEKGLDNPESTRPRPPWLK